MSAEIQAIGQEGLIYDKVFRVMQTVGEMMRDRRYQVADRIIPNTLEEFKDMYTDVRDGLIYRDRMTVPCERADGAQRSRAMVFFTEGLSMESMKRYHTQAAEANCDRVVLVAHGKVNATVKRHIEDLNRSSLSLKVQFFDEDELVVNVTHHELVPKHTPLEEEEVKEMLQAHALSIEQLPRILATDPVAAYYGLERGRVVKIERKMEAEFMSSIGELSVIRLYRAYNTVIQMCADRGFPIRHPSVVAQAMRDPSLYSDEDGLDYDWFIRNFVLQETVNGSPQWTPMRSAMRLVCGTAAASADEAHSARAVLVFFAAPALSGQELHELRNKALQKQARAMIVVSAGRIAPAVRREAAELSGRLRPGTTEELLPVQVFEEEALAFNVARHETVPSHEPLSASAAQELLQSRQLQLSQLPRILEADPMVAYWGLQRGSVVRVQRSTKETGPFDMYRQVI